MRYIEISEHYTMFCNRLLIGSYQIYIREFIEKMMHRYEDSCHIITSSELFLALLTSFFIPFTKATFLVALLQYLLFQGYKAKQIVGN